MRLLQTNLQELEGSLYEAILENDKYHSVSVPGRWILRDYIFGGAFDMGHPSTTLRNMRFQKEL